MHSTLSSSWMHKNPRYSTIPARPSVCHLHQTKSQISHLVSLSLVSTPFRWVSWRRFGWSMLWGHMYSCGETSRVQVGDLGTSAWMSIPNPWIRRAVGEYQGEDGIPSMTRWWVIDYLDDCAHITERSQTTHLNNSTNIHTNKQDMKLWPIIMKTASQIFPTSRAKGLGT